MNSTNVKKGFSLIELLIALSIVCVISLLLTSFISKGFELYGTNRHRLKAQEKASGAMEKISADLQNSTQLIGASGSEIVFLVPEGSLLVRKRYFLSDGILKEGSILPVFTDSIASYPEGNETTKEIIDNLTSSTIFNFLDGSGQALEEPVSSEQVKMIGISFVIHSDPNTPGSVDLSSKVNLRNLKTNL